MKERNHLSYTFILASRAALLLLIASSFACMLSMLMLMSLLDRREFSFMFSCSSIKGRWGRIKRFLYVGVSSIAAVNCGVSTGTLLPTGSNVPTMLRVAGSFGFDWLSASSWLIFIVSSSFYALILASFSAMSCLSLSMTLCCSSTVCITDTWSSSCLADKLLISVLKPSISVRIASTSDRRP